MTERLTINRLGHRGDGIADTAQGAAYVACTLPGETVTVEDVPGHPDRRHLLHVEQASPERTSPDCQHFGQCGGCALQHWPLDRQRAWKHELVREALADAGIEADVAPTVDAHGEGRRRAVLHARRGTRDIVEVGFAAQRAHHIVAIDRCPVLAPSLRSAISIAWRIGEMLAPMRKPLDIHITAADNGLDVDIRGSGPIGNRELTNLASFAERENIARLTRHGELVVQRMRPTLKIGRATVGLPPGAFLQATAAAEDILAGLVDQAIGRPSAAADLFCGIGPFALRLAERMAVTAIDSNTDAIGALKTAATTSQGLKAVTAQARDLFRRPLLAPEMKKLDAVVFDPPRQGAEAQARELAASKVARVVAVSCDRITFARDAKILIDGGYRLTAVTPVDQFRHSPHIEIVAAFTR